MGISIDAAKNEAAVGGAAGDISAPGAATKVLVVPTDEELCIAQQTLGVVEAAAAAGPGGSSRDRAAVAA
jgi:acetate kinase